jgi:hypothetical protein
MGKQAMIIERPWNQVYINNLPHAKDWSEVKKEIKNF